MIFANASQNHGARLIGDNIDELVKEGLKYVSRLKSFYEASIREELEQNGWATISNHSCFLGNSLFIYYDPEKNITEEEANNLSGKEMSIKYHTIKSFKP